MHNIHNCKTNCYSCLLVKGAYLVSVRKISKNFYRTIMLSTHFCLYLQPRIKCNVLINFRMKTTVFKDCEIMIIRWLIGISQCNQSSSELHNLWVYTRVENLVYKALSVLKENWQLNDIDTYFNCDICSLIPDIIFQFKMKNWKLNVAK